MLGSLIEGSVHLWIADLRKWRPRAHDLKHLLSADETGRLNRLKIPSKQNDFLCSRGILRIILSNYSKEDPGELQIEYSSAGKPFMQNAEVQFNISHSKDFLICGVSLSGRVGVDIQEIYSISSIDWIVNHYFSAEEERYLHAIQSEDIYQMHFFAIWTAKEAFLKAVGLGIRESSFNQFSIIPVGEDLQAYHLDRKGFKDDGLEWTIKTEEVAGGYFAALAHDRLITEMKQQEIIPDDFFQP